MCLLSQCFFIGKGHLDRLSKFRFSKRGIDIKVENSKADTAFWEGVIRPNSFWTLRPTKNLGTIVKWGTKS
jgi:hypothetical protein